MSKLSRVISGPVRLYQRLGEGLRWYRLWGTWPVWSWLTAAECFKSGDFRAAAQFYLTGIAANREHPALSSAQLDLAYCFYRLDDFNAALEELDNLIAQRCALKDAYLLCAKINRILGRTHLSLTVLAQGLEICPEEAQIVAQYAHVLLASEADEAEYEEIKQRLIAIKCRLPVEDPANVVVDTALAHFELVCGDLRRGERVLARVLATGRAPFEALLLRGERLLAQGRILPAREMLTKAMRISSHDPRPAMMLAASYQRQGACCNLDFAEQLAQASCKASHWQNSECISILASVYQARGDSGRAQLYLERSKTLALPQELRLGRGSVISSFGKALKLSNS